MQKSDVIFAKCTNLPRRKNKARPKRPQFFFAGIAESSTVSRALVRLEQEAH